MLTDEQLAMRLTGIGGSEIGAVAGLSPYSGPLEVWRRKVEGLRVEENDAMRRGRILEPALLSLYAEETGAILRFPGTLRHPKHPIVLATPDATALHPTGDDVVVEVKTANFRMAEQWGEGEDAVPSHYLAQATWEMACAGRDFADVAVLIGGDDFRRYRLRFDAELFEMLREKAEAFWTDFVLPKRPPPVDGSEGCSDWLKARFPRDATPLLQADADAEVLALTYQRVCESVAAAEEQKAELRNQLISIIGDAAGISGQGWKISYKSTKPRASVDWQAVVVAAEVPPSLIAACTKVTPIRVFRPTWAKEQK